MASKKEQPKSTVSANLARGAFLSCSESLTLGQPFEVWKTRMARFRTETTAQSFRTIYATEGIGGFWSGVGPKMFECATKGAVLLFASEALKDGGSAAGLSPGVTGFVAGAGGGVAQTIVMGPSSFLVTAVVTGKEHGATVTGTVTKALRERGIAGLYPGATAVAFRQGSNWASRMGFNEFAKPHAAQYFHGDAKAKLTTTQEVLCGVMAGIFSCWNHPFDVARVEGQARAVAGEAPMSMFAVLRHVHAEYGMRGLFQGILPRMGFGINQTLFMVTGAKLLREAGF
jgi:hypothetical protein